MIFEKTSTCDKEKWLNIQLIVFLRMSNIFINHKMISLNIVIRQMVHRTQKKLYHLFCLSIQKFTVTRYHIVWCVWESTRKNLPRNQLDMG